jgi:hypothetical protein
MTSYHPTFSLSPDACVLEKSESTELNDRRSSGSRAAAIGANSRSNRNDHP